MNRADLRAIVLDALGGIAPEADLDAVKPDVALREQLDLDSMDMLNFVVALHDATGIDIPEPDYPRLTTLDGSIAYLAAHSAVRPASEARRCSPAATASPGES